jgi:hypothetical protein
MNNTKEVPIYTPVLKATGERFRIEYPIYEEGFRDERGLGKKGVIRDPATGKRYEITGKACSLPHCQCDAWAVEIEASGIGEGAQESATSPSLN